MLKSLGNFNFPLLSLAFSGENCLDLQGQGYQRVLNYH